MEENREIHEPFDQAFENSFDSDYLDPHDAVAFYAWQLSDDARKWQEQGPSKWDGAYSCLASSSSTGKSRLLKQIALHHISTLYLCLRGELEEGYPKTNIPPFARAYCTDPIDISTQQMSEWTFISLVIGFLEGISWLLGTIQSGTDPESYRRILWYVMAEGESRSTEGVVGKHIALELRESGSLTEVLGTNEEDSTARSDQNLRCASWSGGRF
jgi:hypothetical protein